MVDKTQRATADEEWRAATRILLEAAQLISGPQTWTRRAFARDKHSHPVSPTSDRAVRFCVGGALVRAAGQLFDFEVTLSTSPPTSESPAPLLRAYQLLGETMGALLLGPDALEVVGRDWTRPVVHGHVSTGGRRRKTVEETDWPHLVHALNDHEGVSWSVVRLCRYGALATVLAERHGDTSFDIHKWLEEVGTHAEETS